MSFFEEHKLLATAISVSIALAAVVLLYYLSTLSDDDVPAPQDEYSTTISAGSAVADGAGGGGEDGAAAAAATGPGDIQQVDFSQMLAPDIGENQVIEGVLLLDVDGNGSQEALLLVRGPGERRPLDWYLFGLENNTAVRLYERLAVAQGEIRIDGPRIVEQEAEYQQGDADCCPSQAVTNYYVWKNENLQLSKTEATPAGAAG